MVEQSGAVDITLSAVAQALWSNPRRCPNSCAIVRLFRSAVRVRQLLRSVTVLSDVNVPAEFVVPGVVSAHPLETDPSTTFTQAPFVSHALVTRAKVTPVPLSSVFQAEIASSVGVYRSDIEDGTYTEIVAVGK